MKTKNFLTTLLFLIPFIVHSQGTIIAPDAVCLGECHEIYFEGETPNDERTWTVNYNGVLQTYLENILFLCFDQPGNVEIDLWVDSDIGIPVMYTHNLTVGQGGSFTIIADPSCRELSPDSCQQVCAFTTVTYSIDNQTNQPVVWNVDGAVDYTINNNTVTVDWGEPGQGFISVSTQDSTNAPFSFVCDQTGYCDQSPDETCMVSVDISNGIAPFEIYVERFNSSEFIGSFNTNDIVFEYPDPGSYTIRVVDAVNNELQCWIQLSDAPSPGCDFPPFISEEVTPPTGPNSCGGIISISVSGGVPPYIYNWSNGQTSQNLNDICCGNYSLTVTDSGNCTTTGDFAVPCFPPAPSCNTSAEICVNILAEPVAAFSTEPAAVNDVVNICQGQTVFFQNESLNAENFTWDFGPGQVFNDVNANYTYNNPGTFTASLIAANACFCADTTRVTIIVDPSVGPEIDCVGTICEGETITYNSSSDCGTFNWNVSGNGTITEGGGTGDDFITIQWGDGPIGTINLAVDNCSGDFCNVPSTVQIPIISDNATIAGPVAVCNESTVTYSLPNYSGTEYIWSVSNRGTITDGQGTPEITVEWSSGTVPLSNQQVSVDYFNCYLECGGSDQLAVSILPEFYLTGPIEACQNEFSEYSIRRSTNNTLFPANWTVKNTDGTPVSFSGDGTHTITVDWSADNGNYVVAALPLNGAIFCSVDEATRAVKVEAPPVAPAGITGADEVCPFGSYSYRTNGLPGHIFQWEINNGGTVLTEEGPQINVRWGANEPYEISVRQKNTVGPGCSSLPITLSVSQINEISINELTDACVDQLATYSATLSEDVEYFWQTNTDAGTIVEGQGSDQIKVLWHREGDALLSLIVCGSLDIINVAVQPKQNPVVNHPAGLCELAAGAVSTTQTYSTYEWRDEFGGFVSNDASPDLFPGYYELMVTDNFGCEENTSFYIETFPAPVITISTPGDHGYCPALGGAPVLYALDDPEGYTYQWQFQGVDLAGETATQTIGDQFGTYTVVVTDANGCTNVSNNLTVYDLCNVEEPGPGNPSPVCFTGTNVTFDRIDDGSFCDVRTYQNTSINYIPGTLFWYHKIGDVFTSFSTDEMPEYRFEKAGYYKVYLVAQSTDGSGQPIICRDVMIDTIPVSADFEYEGACIGEEIVFTDLSTFLLTENIVSWQWNFGDPASGANNTSALESPVHVFSGNGTFDVSLMVTNVDGCQSVKNRQVSIYNNPVVDFEQPPATCEATAVEFIFSGTTNVIDIEWDFGDPGSGDANSSFIKNTYHNYNTPGTYTVTMTVTNIYGCSASMSREVNIEANNLTGTIGLSQPSPICEGDQITLTAPAGGVTWAWSTGENTEQITVGLEDIYGVTVTDTEGCTYAPPASVIEVIPAPNGTIRVVEYDDFDQPEQYIYGSYGTCEGEDVFMEIEGVSGYSYSWTGGSSQTEIEFSEDRGNLLTAGTYQYFITITDNTTGCTNITAPMNIEIYPLPSPFTISADIGGVVCAGNTVTYSVDSPYASLTYVWNNEEVGTSITVEEPGDYYAVAISAFGCERNSNILRLNPGPDINLVPSGCHTRCNPDTLCLPPIPGIVSYQWYFNGAPVPAPNGNELELIATESGAYQLEMTDAIGCTLLSEALTLDLYNGVGDISGTVYYDQNNNGLIDPTDSIITNIPVSLDDVNGLVNTVNADQNGEYLFDNVPSTDYRLTLDTTVLASNHQALVAVIDTVLTGCDEEITVDWLIIEVCESFTTTLVLNTCDGASLTYAGETLPVGVTTPVTLTAGNGCDSVVQVTVIDNSSFTENESYSACAGTEYDYHGTMIAAGTTQQFDFTSVNGCDSIITVTINALNTTPENKIFAVCTGETIDYDGTPVSAGTTQDFTLTSTQGCDSVVTITVTEILPQVITETYTVCADESYDYNGNMIPAGTTESFSFTGYQGCDSMVNVVVDAFAPLTFNLSAEIICPGSSMGEVEISNPSGGEPPYQFSINGDAPQSELIFTDLMPGEYSILMMDASNCQLEEFITIENYEPVELTFEESYTIPCEEEGILLSPTTISGFTEDLVLTWEGTEEGTTYEVTTPGIYTVEAANFCGSQMFSVEVGLADFEGDIIYIPNVFSPNGDGINDTFEPSMSVLSEVVDYELKIFNRWGSGVFNSNNVQLGWDGGVGRNRQNSGVYIYTLSAKINVCGRMIDVVESGDLTLLR